MMRNHLMHHDKSNVRQWNSRRHTIRRTIQRAQECEYGKATEAIQSDGILPPSQEVVSALAEKHPQSCPGD